MTDINVDVKIMFESKKDGKTNPIIPDCYHDLAVGGLQLEWPKMYIPESSPPRKIRIAAFDIRIIHSTGDCYWSPREQAIHVITNLKPMCVLDALLSEINRAIFWAYGLEEGDPEYRIVSTMATAWAQIYRDNPRLITWISEVSHVR